MPAAPSANVRLAEDAKMKGNEAFKKKDWCDAAAKFSARSCSSPVPGHSSHSDRCLPCQHRATSIDYYTAAIGHDGTNHLYYGNRSFSYLNAGDFERSLADARASTKIAPDFSKGFYRAGQALQGLKRYKEAAASYREGLKLDPANEDSQARLKECEKALQAEEKLAKERLKSAPKSTQLREQGNEVCARAEAPETAV